MAYSGVTTSASEPPRLPGIPDARGPAAPAVVARVLTPPPAAATWFERVLRFARTLVVGAWASLLDFAVILLCVRVLQWNPTASRALALVVSGVLLFFGNRSFAFRAQAGSISRQARLFIAAELVGFALNLLVFRLLVTRVAFLPPEVSSQIANFVVFVSFCYPLRAFVIFRVPGRTLP